MDEAGRVAAPSTHRGALTDHGRPRTTLAAVASRAGVTIPTASKALNQRSDVSAATRQRVLEAVAALGYVKSRRAGPTGLPSTGLLHLVVTSLHGAFHQAALAGVETIASELGLDTVVVLVHDDPGPGADPGRDWVQRVLDRPSDGAVLVMLQPSPAQRDQLDAANVLWMLLDPSREPARPAPSVGAANWSGGYAAATHLIEHGHRHVAVLGGRAGDLVGAARMDGFRTAFAAQALALEPDRIRYAEWSRDCAERMTTELLATSPRCTAVFACSDTMALGAMQAARRHGLGVPEALSIVGFDDLPEARWCYPPLTTVAQPVEEMGAEAVRMLVRMRRGDQPLAGRIELPTALVVRGSSGPAPH